MIVNDDSSIINKLETSLIDNARVIIYDRHMFIVQATGERIWQPIYPDCIHVLMHCFKNVLA
jgi:hypothetical protein